MKKYIKSSVVELKDGSTENISSGDVDDFRWLIEDRLGYECANYFDEIIDGKDEFIEYLFDIIKDECIPYIRDKEGVAQIKEILADAQSLFKEWNKL